MTCSLKTQTKQKPTIVSSTIYGLAGGVFLGEVFLCYFCCFLNCHGCEIYEHVMMIVMIVPILPTTATIALTIAQLTGLYR